MPGVMINTTFLFVRGCTKPLSNQQRASDTQHETWPICPTHTTGHLLLILHHAAGLIEIDGVFTKGVRIKVENCLCLHDVGQPRTVHWLPLLL